ncbi:hypothetical protein K474DRAFT_1674431 [Panus rudis PR-1116 ss-1]|nr:hypothetical protein K474DRAFT_1674431 [Panus rudis PR-1116 ss-1]
MLRYIGNVLTTPPPKARGRLKSQAFATMVAGRGGAECVYYNRGNNLVRVPSPSNFAQLRLLDMQWMAKLGPSPDSPDIVKDDGSSTTLLCLTTARRAFMAKSRWCGHRRGLDPHRT